jgi:hypothetical protein
MDGKSAGWLGVRDAVFVRDPEQASACCNGFTALIGARTLALLRKAGASALHRNVKVPRGEVRAMIVTLAVTLASRAKIDAIFNRAKL